MLEELVEVLVLTVFGAVVVVVMVVIVEVVGAVVVVVTVLVVAVSLVVADVDVLRLTEILVSNVVVVIWERACR